MEGGRATAIKGERKSGESFQFKSMKSAGMCLFIIDLKLLLYSDFMMHISGLQLQMSSTSFNECSGTICG